MEVVAADVGATVGGVSRPICNLLCGWVSSKVKTTLNIQSNLDLMVEQMESLMDRSKKVKDETEAAEKEGNVIRAQVVTWFENVEKLREKVNLIQEQMVNKKKPSACFLNCSKRYRESREVEEILKEIKRLLQAVSFPTVRLEHIHGPSIRSQTTASKALDQTLSLLYDDMVGTIGICGVGGVGKTTLVQNLKNELCNSNSTQPFGIVIWASVSIAADIKQVQTEIAQGLNLETKSESVMLAIRIHRRLMNEEKFLLILDDVWAKIDLNILGVPKPQVHNGCKIILTSRSEDVCRSMETDVIVKMDVWNEEEALQLFCEKAGDVLNDEEIKPLAKEIVGLCCGLPIAIVTIATALRRKTKEQWKDALNQLRMSVPSMEDTDSKVYMSIKLAYDFLRGNNIKSCFLYCSLFPEDFSIEISELVQYWLAEGLIDEQQNYVDSIDTGMALIEELKRSFLLLGGKDEGIVKMHDVIRDFAIRIASSSEDGCKSLVRSGIGLSEISVEEFSNSNSNSLKRVSFMNNDITRLPDCVIQCSEASTLLLQDNRPLQTVPETFLQGFEALRVLNLRQTSIRSLPLSLLQLGDLRALLLRDCTDLEELPPLGRLSRLQLLDLRHTGIRELPRGMENLSNLRQLDLSCTMNLKTFQPEIISRLSCLEVLDVTYVAYSLLGMGMEEAGQTAFEELRCLDRLLFLSISFKRIPHLSSEDLSLVNRLRGFQIFIDPKGGFSSIFSTTNDKGVSFCNVDISQESIGQLWGIAKSLKFVDCQGVNENIIDLGINSVGCFAGLKSLEICSVQFNMSLKPNGGLAARCDLLPNLEELTLNNLKGLESISDLAGYLGLGFLRLKLIEVGYCYDMKYLLSYGDFIRTLPKLEVIKVDTCKNLYELFNYDSVQNMALDPVPNLRILKLESLPKLRTLCRDKETWPLLEHVEVLNCDSLKRLFHTGQNAGTIKEIKGESEWWDALEWDDDETRSNLLRSFRPTLPEF